MHQSRVMEFNTSDSMEIPVENIKSHVDVSQIENYSQFSAIRLAKKYYERLGFLVLEGMDFENNLIMYFYDNEDRMLYDEYIKVKIGKSHVTTDVIDYSEQLLNAMPEETIKLLLILCRFCSYVGGPGFPDLVVIDKESKKWLLKYVLYDELSVNQKTFLLLSKLAGIETGIVKVGEDGKLEIDISDLLSSILNERRATNIMNGLEENINEAREKFKASEGKGDEDELNYLLNEKGKNPLFLFDKWLKSGRISSYDLIGLMEFTAAQSKNSFDVYLKELESDQQFAAIKGKTEDAMKQRAEYMQRKFGIGQTKSKLLLNFF